MYKATLLFVTIAILFSPRPGACDTIPIHKTVRRILQQEYPECRFEAQQHFLDDHQRAIIKKQMGTMPPSNLVVSYHVVGASGVKSIVFFDTHRVRTASETLMIAVTPEGSVQRVKAIAFGEPDEYLPRKAWYEQFEQMELSPSLALRNDIQGITGATITVRKTTDAVRRVLSLHKAIFGEPSSS